MIDLIPISYLNEACFISLNIDDKKTRMCLKMSQSDLSDDLGEEFYNEILTQYDAETLTTDNNALYEGYIKDYLAWKTYFNYLKFANVETTPTGIRTFNDDNSDIASDIQMYSLKNNVLNEFVKCKGRMINYIRTSQVNTSTKYPLFRDRCGEEFSFAITSVDKKSDALFSINKAIRTNE